MFIYGPNSNFLNLDLMFFGVRVAFKALDVHVHRFGFFTHLFLFNNVHEFLFFLKVVLKDLKHDTSRGCRA